MPGSDFNSVEPMQVDLPPEENENTEEEVFVIENPTLDMETYINSYSGMARLLRLNHIADHCPTLRIEAIKMAIITVQGTYNVAMYQQLHKKLRTALNGQAANVLPDVTGNGNGGASTSECGQLDVQWVEQKSKKASLKLEKLDADLKNYKSNSIKESIRRGHDDLAEHYLECGDLTNALKCFSRARDYCTSAKHVINMCLNVIKVSIYLQNWTHVLNFVSKAENTPEVAEGGKASGGKDNNNAIIVTKLRCAAGLADLAMKKYKSAAKYFLQANLDHCDFSDMLSPNNVAIYGGLCALATFDRNELQKNVISSSSFKLFLELEPQIRDVIFKFYESKYASCLRLLDEMRDNLLLDIYLAQHVKSLYNQIRNRGLIQYFSPYASADLNLMSQSFNTTVPALENEIMQLILDGQIQARIDSHNKVLYAKNMDQRSVTFEKTLKMGFEYERRTKLMILRAALVKSQIQVKNPQKENQNEAPGNSNSRGSHRD